ncbi:MAG: GNAT family N-acetyltransferase [Candidatus Omnitrophota bacterium]
MEFPIIIRKYERRDRLSVRQIACDTADKGEPLENFFSDRYIAADLITKYYTDYNKEFLWVAEYNGEVIGYLTGCINDKHYTWIMITNILPYVIFIAFFRGVFLDIKTWKLLKAIIMTFSKRVFTMSEDNYLFSQKDYPAHLHINLKNGYRGQNIGRGLVDKFIDQLRAKGIKGVYASVREDNTFGCNFFEHLGFRILAKHSLVLSNKNGLYYTITYGKQIL